MDYNGLQWATMDYNGLQWTTMDYIGLQWTTKNFNYSASKFFRRLLSTTIWD